MLSWGRRRESDLPFASGSIRSMIPFFPVTAGEQWQWGGWRRTKTRGERHDTNWEGEFVLCIVTNRQRTGRLSGDKLSFFPLSDLIFESLLPSDKTELLRSFIWVISADQLACHKHRCWVGASLFTIRNKSLHYLEFSHSLKLSCSQFISELKQRKSHVTRLSSFGKIDA